MDLEFDDDIVQAIVMLAILAFGLLAGVFLVLRFNSERFNLPVCVRCLLCLPLVQRKNSMYPTIRIAPNHIFDPSQDMEKATRKFPFLDLNMNRKISMLKNHNHPRKTIQKITPHQSIYTIPGRKMTWANSHSIDEKRLISPTSSNPTDGTASIYTPSSFCCNTSDINSSVSTDNYKVERRRSL